MYQYKCAETSHARQGTTDAFEEEPSAVDGKRTEIPDIFQKQEVLKKLAAILEEEKLITELEYISLKEEIEEYGGTLCQGR